MEVFKEYRFESAHWLPHVAEGGHPCGRMHGHSYRVVLRVRGALGEQTGWVIDFAELDSAFLPLRETLDHHVLNEIEGLVNPTCEVLAQWLFERMVAKLPELSCIEVWETADAGCVLRAEDR